MPDAPPPHRHNNGPLNDDVWCRFWPKVRAHGPKQCWEWQGALTKKGYGKFGLRARATVSAHRLAYEFVKGPIPDGLIILHACDNRRCCNPAHLTAGTYSDNTQDGIRKGRIVLGGPAGERSNLAKLTQAQALEIRRRYEKGCGWAPRGNGRQLAAEFGVTMSQIVRIASGRNFKHLAEAK